MGEMWRGLDAEGKQEWNDKAEAEKARYEAEMKDYIPLPKAPVDSDDSVSRIFWAAPFVKVSC